MQPEIQRYCEWIWIGVGLVWLAGTVKVKPAVRRQGAAGRWQHIAVMALAFGLLFSSSARVGPLVWRWLPDSAIMAWTGLALTAAGCAYAVWARLLLAGNWSGSVTIKQDHELVRKGPYAIVRHPIYSGALLAMLGTALVQGELHGLAAVVLAFFGFLTKSRVEEAFMTSQFGPDYVQYQRDVKALIPFVL